MLSAETLGGRMKAVYGLLVAMLALLPSVGAQAQTWQEVRPAKGGYRIEMPAAPKFGVESVPLNGRSAIPMQTALVEADNKAFLATYLDYPREAIAGMSPDTMLTNVMNGSANGHRLVSQRKLSVGGNPAREYVIARSNGVTLITRSVLVDNRLYQLIVASKGAGQDANTQRFLESFALTAR